MILSCDTSALIRLLISEPGSDQMMESSLRAEAIAVCRITWAETMAGMARRQRLIDRWDHFTIVEVSQPLVETAGRFADVFGLRGYDSVQLAASHELHINGDHPVLFASYDRRLNQAAQLLQLEVLP